MAAFVAWERRARYPMLPLSYFRNRGFATANAAIFFQFISVIGSLFFIIQLFQIGMGYSPLQAGLRILAWMAMPMLVAPSPARWPTRSATGRCTGRRRRFGLRAAEYHPAGRPGGRGRPRGRGVLRPARPRLRPRAAGRGGGRAARRSLRRPMAAASEGRLSRPAARSPTTRIPSRLSAASAERGDGWDQGGWHRVRGYARDASRLVRN